MTDNTGDIASQVAGVFGGQQQLNTMNTEAKRMLTDAQAGRWAVNEETGEHLRRAVSQMVDRLADIDRRIYLLKQAPKLGNDQYAQQVASHFLTAMYSDDRSLVRVFELARETLDTLQEAITTAISKYDAADDAVKQALSTFKDEQELQ